MIEAHFKKAIEALEEIADGNGCDSHYGNGCDKHCRSIAWSILYDPEIQAAFNLLRPENPLR